MLRLSTHRVVAVGFAFLILLSLNRCTQRGALLSGSWLSEFKTVSTAITGARTSDLALYATVDVAGSLYLSGTSNGSWVVTKSTDGGTTWTQQFSAGATSYGHQVASDSLGNVFAVGATSCNACYGTIKKYDVGTGLWSTAYNFQVESGKLTYLEGIAIDSNDHIYVVGQATVTLLSPDGWPDSSVTKMIVLKSTNHGSTWNIVDSFAIDDYGWTRGYGAYVAATGEVYAYATSIASTRTQNAIRKSGDAGATWTRVYEDFGTNVRGISAWGTNLILNEDFYGGAHNAVSSRVRGTADNFSHLTLLDTFKPEGATAIFSGMMTVDPNGRAYYPVQYADADGATHLVVRGSRGTGEWITLDDYKVPAGESLYVSQVIVGKDGSVYNLGVHSSTAGNTWILRKATLSSQETATPETVGEGDDLISPIPSGAKRIYLTAQTHDGNWGSTAAAAMANADAACNSDANRPLVSSSANYKAFLVSSVRTACTTASCSGGASENVNWVLAPNTSYVTREGIALGTTNSAAIFTTFSRALLTNIVDRAWTGLDTANRDWTTVADEQCDNWTTNDSGSWATAWTPRATDYGDIYTGSNWLTCDTAQRLICVEQ